jgi:hypothetical protein
VPGELPSALLLTATPYVDWLVRVLRESADEELAALHAARLPTAVTIPVTVIRHQCPHCRRTWARKSAGVSHVARCWNNPDVRACKTCAWHQEARWSSHQCIPSRDCGCDSWPEACCHPDGPTWLAQPVTGCPLWQPVDDSQ